MHAGGLCGSIFADHEFEYLMRRTFGNSKWQKISSTAKARIMNDDWEHGIKRNFRDDPTKEWCLQIPSETVAIINIGSKRKFGNGLRLDKYVWKFFHHHSRF
jgi:hypothetical protein